MGLVNRAFLAAATALFGSCGLSDPPPSVPSVRFLAPYVGQGHGVALLHDRSALVFDAGPPGRDELWRALRQAGVERIAAVFLTHPDLDHWGGLDSLLAHFPVDRLLHGPIDSYRLAQTFGWACRQAESGCETISAGQSFSGLEGLRVDVLWPESDAAFDEPNEGSLVLRAVWKDRGLLLVSGDLDTLGERRLAPHLPAAEIVQLGHHGSRSSGHLRFLGAATPRWIVVQAGLDNDYGHPTTEALDRARAVGASVVRPLPGDPFQAAWGP